MFCSTIIPTIGRPSLGRAVESVLSQNLPGDSFEVIVVNDSGEPLCDEAWQHSDQVRIIHTNRHNRSVARNAGAAIAKGRYLHFLDDDDWMLPGAFQSLQSVAKISKAAWVYGAFSLVDNAGDLIAEISPEEEGNCFIQMIYWEWIPIQASLIKSEVFFARGGFDSKGPFSTVFQDTDLSRQILRYYEMARTGEIVSCIRAGDVGSTTNYGAMFVANRLSREKSLSLPGAFSRMRASANDAYWHGRIVYCYLASLMWNWQQRRVLTAASRGTYALAGGVTAGRHLFSADFWRGAIKPHFNRVRTAVEAANYNLLSQTSWE
ncbi:MAG: glycosyltransferase family 2 protein [Anaerolineae bacterium]|nr:glycosyltransferase family 2 protein [Anaerolineae bacterium]